MKLTDLHPRWWTVEGANNKHIGMTFDCPHCLRRLSVAFHEDGNALFDRAHIQALCGDQQKIWTRNGTDFERLTLSPSIDVEGHWHGFITYGEVITV